MVVRFFLGHISAPEGSDHCDNNVDAAASGRGRAPWRRRLGGALMPLMLASPGDPTAALGVDAAVPHAADAAESGCLSLARGADGQLAFSSGARNPGGCSLQALPLVQKTVFGSGTVSSGLEFSNMDLGQMTAHEVALKFGLGRDLPILGLHATVDGSVGRVLGNFTPVLDEQVHATFSRSLIAHWDTGLEARLASVGAIGPVQPTERTGLLFLRGRYKLAGSQGVEQNLELKLSADSLDSTTQTPARHARADLRYEYHRDANVLSIGLNAVNTEQTVGPTGASVGLNIRASRKF
jgi:hypothetical protein